MERFASTQPQHINLPVVPHQPHCWNHLVVEQFQHPSGEGTCLYQAEHAICLSLAPRPVRLLQMRDGKTYRGLYGKGDLSINPVDIPFFARWDGDDHYVQLRIAAEFLRQVAEEALDLNPDGLELIPEFRTRDPQIEAIALLLLAEIEQNQAGERLYVESLAHVLAVHLLRRYTTTQPRPTVYTGGLPERHLLRVLDYIAVHLHQSIKLADLAAVVQLSPFHFSHQFKRSLGMAPYQYVLQQRIERAKQLLQETSYPITEIAFLCGFNSHSHLSQQFRQYTGITPKAYRSQVV
jgi:AraC family transcriptional regulator